MGVGRTWDSRRGVDDELQNIQAILPSSEISSEIDKNKELIWPEVEKSRW
jgi:hypothetical protein